MLNTIITAQTDHRSSSDGGLNKIIRNGIIEVHTATAPWWIFMHVFSVCMYMWSCLTKSHLLHLHDLKKFINEKVTDLLLKLRAALLAVRPGGDFIPGF